MSGVYEQYLIRLLAPLGLYDLSGVQNRSELAALGMELDNVSAALDTVERRVCWSRRRTRASAAGRRCLPESRRL